jgi:hypothetical protein
VIPFPPITSAKLKPLSEAIKTMSEHETKYGDDTCESVEAAILRKNLNAARVKPADIEANIIAEVYQNGLQGVADVASLPKAVATSLGLLTICIIVTRNGFVEIGTSAYASPENFDKALGQRIARDNAKNKLWPLMGYALREQLTGNQTMATGRVDER